MPRHSEDKVSFRKASDSMGNPSENVFNKVPNSGSKSKAPANNLFSLFYKQKKTHPVEAEKSGTGNFLIRNTQNEFQKATEYELSINQKEPQDNIVPSCLSNDKINLPSSYVDGACTVSFENKTGNKGADAEIALSSTHEQLLKQQKKILEKHSDSSFSNVLPLDAVATQDLLEIRECASIQSGSIENSRIYKIQKEDKSKLKDKCIESGQVCSIVSCDTAQDIDLQIADFSVYDPEKSSICYLSKDFKKHSVSSKTLYEIHDNRPSGTHYWPIAENKEKQGGSNDVPPHSNNRYQEQEEDFFQITGKFYGNKLRYLSPEQRIKAERLIMDVFHKLELETLDENSKDKHSYARAPLDRTKEPPETTLSSQKPTKKLYANLGNMKPNGRTLEKDDKEERMVHDCYEEETMELERIEDDYYNDLIDQEYLEKEALRERPSLRNKKGIEDDYYNDLIEQEYLEKEALRERPSLRNKKGIEDDNYDEQRRKLIERTSLRNKNAPRKEQIYPHSWSIGNPKVEKPYKAFGSKSLMLFVLIVAIFVLAAQYSGLQFPPKVSMSSQIDVSTIMNNLEKDFKEQPMMTFKIVKGAIRNVMETDPRAPAIILLFAGKGAGPVSNGFAHQLARSISPPNEVIVIDGSTFKMEDPDIAKKDIDNRINSSLSKDKLRTVLVERLDYIPAEAAMIFHTYCDHENAPFKRVVYVMTVVSEKTLQTLEPKDWDSMLQEHLYSAWSTAGNDQVSSLLSRLTVSVAAIVPKQ